MWEWQGREASGLLPVSPGEPGHSGMSTDQEARSPHLVSVIRKVDLVENLGGFVLDGLHLHQVWGVLPGPISKNHGAGKEGTFKVRNLWVRGAMGSKEQKGLSETDPLLFPFHHFLTSYQVTVTQLLRASSCSSVQWNDISTHHVGTPPQQT